MNRIRGIAAAGKAWTADEVELVRSRYVADGAKAIAASLGRTRESVEHKAARLGLRILERWTADEDRRLRNMWGEEPIDVIATRIGRRPYGVFMRARALKLKLGKPRGMEHLTASAVRAGYAVGTLRKILAWAGVPIRRVTTKPREPRWHQHYVDPFDVDQAVARWLETETVNVAARERGIHRETLIRRLVSVVGDELPRNPPGRRHWRVPTVLIERALGRAA